MLSMKPVIVVLGLFSLLPLAACTPATQAEPSPVPLTPTTMTEPILADCFITFYLSAFEDLNADGLRDPGEPPLSGVEFILNGNYAESLAGGRALTDADGQAVIDTWSPGECAAFNTRFSIDAQPPAGYTPTSEFPVDVAGDQLNHTNEYGFRSN